MRYGSSRNRAQTAGTAMDNWRRQFDSIRSGPGLSDDLTHDFS
jgi:hypothetical protein